MIPDHLVAPIYTASFAAVFASFVGWLPPIASLAAIIVCCITVYESHTYTNWRAGVVTKKTAKKLARLRAKEKLIVAEIIATETKRAHKVEAREMVADAASTAAQLVVHEASVAAAPK